MKSEIFVREIVIFVREIVLSCEYKIVEVCQTKIVCSYGSESVLVSHANLLVEYRFTVYRGHCVISL